MSRQPSISVRGSGTQRVVGHTLARLTHKPVELEDIKAELVRAMLASSRQDIQQTVVANRYLILLNPRDYATYMHMQQLTTELEQYVLARGQHYRLRFGGIVQVELWPAPGIYLRVLTMLDSRLALPMAASNAPISLVTASPGIMGSGNSVSPANGVAAPAMNAPPTPSAAAPAAGNAPSGPAIVAASNLPTAAIASSSLPRGYTQTMAPIAGLICARCKAQARPGAHFCNRCGQAI